MNKGEQEVRVSEKRIHFYFIFKKNQRCGFDNTSQHNMKRLTTSVLLKQCNVLFLIAHKFGPPGFEWREYKEDKYEGTTTFHCRTEHALVGFIDNLCYPSAH